MQVRIYGPENIGTALPSVEAPEGKTFKGWKIGEKTYTSVTEELLDALADAEDTVQAEPVFQDKEQGAGNITCSGRGLNRAETEPISLAAETRPRSPAPGRSSARSCGARPAALPPRPP